MFPVVLRAAVIAACLFGIWSSWKLARADYLFRQDTPSSVLAAARLVPSEPRYYMRLAQLDETHARELLETALRLNRFNAQAAIELGLQYEAEGDYAQAEKLLLQAWAADRTYLPRWSLANYYLRRDNTPAFWFWAHKAAEMPSTDITPLFGLCWRVTPDAATITKEVLTDNPDTLRQYLGFLVGKDQVRAVADVAPRLLRYGNVDTDRPLLLWVVNRLLAANDGAAATALWRLLAEQRWVVADATVPNNATFSRDPLPVGFDWALPFSDGLHALPGPSGLEVEFSGRQAESCIIADQFVALAPGSYHLRYEYRTSGIPPGTGIEWRILNAASESVLAASPDLSSDTLKQQWVAFSVPPAISLIRVRLNYDRALGTPRVSGMLVLTSIGILAGASHDLSGVR
jgi:hypothetical protein